MEPQLFNTPADDLTTLVEALNLSDDQAHILKIIAKTERAALLTRGKALWFDRTQGKERFNEARAIAGMAEGVVHLVALLAADQSIADDPDANL